MSSLSLPALSMFSVFECWGTRSDALLLVIDADPKDTPSSKSMRSPRLAVEPTLLLAIMSERLPPVDPMDDVDEAFGDADASTIEPE